MATALAGGWLRAGLAERESLLASDPLEAAREKFTQATGCRAVADNQAVAAQSDVLVLAVKPQHVAAALDELKGRAVAGKLVISIAAGVTLEALSRGLGSQARLIRVMPNTPCLVGQGASAFCLGPGATADDGRFVDELLCAVGRAVQVPEAWLDAVTGLSGSGPAFVFLMIEALSDGGVKAGLPRDVATLLAAQTVRGAAEMVLATGEHPAALKDGVASPGGTTIAGLAALEAGAARHALMAAVEAATNRSRELGRSQEGC
jgi:pyrroline-5-carboxylate reductase